MSSWLVPMNPSLPPGLSTGAWDQPEKSGSSVERGDVRFLGQTESCCSQRSTVPSPTPCSVPPPLLKTLTLCSSPSWWAEG